MAEPTDFGPLFKSLEQDEPAADRKTLIKLTWDEMTAAVARYNAGESLASLSAAFAVAYSTMYVNLRRMGVEVKRRKRPTKLTPAQRLLIQQRYPDEGPAKLATELGVKERHIRRVAGDVKVKITTVGKRRAEENKSVNVHFFDQWSDEMAYILGYIWADGCVDHRPDKKTYRLVLRCTRTDDYLIKAIASRICTKIVVRELDAHQHQHKNGKFFVSKACTAIYIHSQILTRTLVEQHGLSRRKSFLDLPFPFVPPERLPHFVRGYFDGDGTAALSKFRRGKVTWGACGSRQFIYGLRDAISTALGLRAGAVTPDGGIFKIFWTTQSDVAKLYRWMYPTEDVLCLTRKKDRLAVSLGT